MLFALMLAMAAQGGSCDHAREAALQEEARNATSQRQYGVAARSLEQAAAACPESTASRVLLAGTYLMARRPKEALAEAERILKDHPSEAAALKVKGNSAYLLGDTRTAIDTFIRLLDQHPTDDEGAYMLGRIYYQEGRIDLAIGQFERALKIRPSSYKVLDNLGLCYVATGDDDKAMRYYLAAIKLAPDYEWPYINTADLLLKKGDVRKAFDAASMATARNPLSPRAFYTGAKALELLDKSEESLNWAQRASALDPDYSDAWYLIARLYKKLGQEEKAKEAREKFLAAKAKEPPRRK